MRRPRNTYSLGRDDRDDQPVDVDAMGDRRRCPDAPVRRSVATLSYLQIACAAISTTIIVFMCMFWAIPAFRPGDMPPDIVRALSDIAYFLIVWPYFPFTIWVLAVGLSVLLDSGKDPVFPR